MASFDFDFDILYREHAATLLHIALRKLDDKEQAMDVVQDLFVDLWQRRSMINITGNPQHYLVSALYHKIFQHFRKVGLNQKHIAHFKVLQTAADEGMDRVGEDDFEEHHALTIRHIDHSVEQMSPRMRTIFELKYYQSYSNQEIASLLGISNQTVKNQLSRSLDQVRKELAEKSVHDTVFIVPLLSYILLQ
ncbi:sigma-70 family RNA polymerase sigma factor [Sphingobacterium sp. lm-10]|nr:sigma-70 family RNA polymerase sigma factor [Sphingobacterium sp. lm-10]